MSHLSDAPLSLFRGATDAHPVRTVPLRAVLDAMQMGAYRLPIARLRHVRATQGQAAYNTAKQRLDAVTFGGTFALKRSKTTLRQHSGLVHGDIDHLDDVQAMKALLCADDYTAYCFVSPSGDGLKLGVPVAPVADDAAYKHDWQAVAEYFKKNYGVTWDPSGKDVCRLCFMSWDPDVYRNPKAQVFPVPVAPVAPVPYHPMPPSLRHPVPHDRRDWYARTGLDRATQLIERSIPGQQHYARCTAAYLLGGYISGGLLAYDEAYAALEAAVGRTAKDVRRAMQTIRTGLEAGMQAPITIEYLERERQQWRATHWHIRARGWTGQLRTVAAEELPPWHA